MLKDFFASYSLPTILIAVLVATLKGFLDGYVKSETTKKLIWYLPFLAGVLFSYLYNVIFLGIYAFDQTVVCSGVLSGALSYAVALIGRKIAKGEALPINPALAIIEGLVMGYLKEDCVKDATLIIYEHYSKMEGDEEGTIEKINETLILYSNGLLAEGEIKALSKVILSTLGGNL